MDNSTAIPLQGDVLLLNQLELVSPTTVAGTFYGIAFVLFCLYINPLVPRLRDEDRGRQAKLMFAYSTVIMLCGLCILILNAWGIQDAYIKHSNYPRGPIFYIESIYRGSPVVIVILACQATIDTLTSAIQIWRVWVIWSATRYAQIVTVIPILCFLTFTGLTLRTVIIETTLPSASVFRLDTKTQLAESAIQGATTVLCTTLVSGYLIFKQWQQRKLIGRTQGSTGYMDIVALLIESYALESIWFLTSAVIWNQVVRVFFSESMPYIEIIAYFLVQYRVASGEAYESQRGHTNISSLRWNHSNYITTHAGETSEMQSGPHVSAIPQPSNGQRVSSMA